MWWYMVGINKKGQLPPSPAPSEYVKEKRFTIPLGKNIQEINIRYQPQWRRITAVNIYIIDCRQKCKPRSTLQSTHVT